VLPSAFGELLAAHALPDAPQYDIELRRLPWERPDADRKRARMKRRAAC
jgi:hypothetical protein